MADDLPINETLQYFVVPKLRQIAGWLSDSENIDEDENWLRRGPEGPTWPPERGAKYAVENLSKLNKDVLETERLIDTLPPHPLLLEAKAALILAHEGIGQEDFIAGIALRNGEDESAVYICRQAIRRAYHNAGDLLRTSYARLEARMGAPCAKEPERARADSEQTGAMRLAQKFLGLRDRFHRIAAHPQSNAGRQLLYAQANGGRLIKEAVDAGFIELTTPGLAECLSSVLRPGANPEMQVRGWSTYWVVFILAVAKSNPDALLDPLAMRFRPAEGCDAIGTTDPSDWQIRCENFAEMAERLAEWIGNQDAELSNSKRNRPTSNGPSELPNKPDKKTDIGKNFRKSRRPMNKAAVACAKEYRKLRAAGEKSPMRQVVTDYVNENGGKVETILRILNDNPEQWKHDTKADKNPTS